MIKATIDIAAADKYLNLLPKTMFGQAKKAFKTTMYSIEGEVKKNATDVLNVRSGMLRRSIGNEVSGDRLENLKASLYAAAKADGKEIVYAPIHEYGGTIRAKKAYTGVPGGPYLNIPTDSNKTPAGVMRVSARQVFSSGGTVIKLKSGKYGVLLNDKLMFVLVKSVNIPQRLGMRKAAIDGIPTLLSNLREVILR